MPVAAPQGLVCLMMTTAGLVGKSDDELPAGVEIDEVVVGELLALKLRGSGDAGSGAVDVKRGGLVRIFAIAQAGGASGGEGAGSRRQFGGRPACVSPRRAADASSVVAMAES